MWEWGLTGLMAAEEWNQLEKPLNTEGSIDYRKV